MTSRELVLRSLDRRGPARIPRQLWVLPWAQQRYPAELRRITPRFPDDTVGCPYFSAAVTTVGDPYAVGTYVDEWGCTFANRQAGIIGEVKEPLVAHLEDIERVVDLNEMGVDALNSQGFCMGRETLGGDFRGRITFWGELDRQQLLPHGQRDDIIAAVRRYNECFYDHGGVIAQLEFGPGARPDNVETALAAWDAFPADS